MLINLSSKSSWELLPLSLVPSELPQFKALCLLHVFPCVYVSALAPVVFFPGQTTKEHFSCQPSSPGMDLQVLDAGPKSLLFLVSNTLEQKIRAVFLSPPIFHQFLPPLCSCTVKHRGSQPSKVVLTCCVLSLLKS